MVSIDNNIIQYSSVEVSYSFLTTDISVKSYCFAHVLSLDAVVVCGVNTEDL